MTGRFDVEATPIEGLHVLQRQPVTDERGMLERMFCADDLGELMGARKVAQVNRTLTEAGGTVRGMHYQVPPSAETKIVSCLRGAIFDVAIDVRHGSPTFLEWHAEVLDGDNRRSLFIPEGFAHGLQALDDDTEILYVTTAAYEPTAERGIHPNDPRVGIAWPMPVAHLSARDAAHPPLTPAFAGIDV